MFFYKTIKILLSSLILFINSFSQIDEIRVVTKIGSYEIKEDMFLERYELMPQMKAAVSGISTSLKKEVLYSIIAEKLFALEAEELRLSNSELISSTYKAIEKMYVRDALYREEIINKVNPSDKYVLEAFKRNSKTLRVNYLFSDNENEILSLYKKIEEGASFDSLLLKRPENSLQKEIYKVNYGQMEKEVENHLYNMVIGEVSRPLKSPNGWYIFKLIAVEEKVINNPEQAESEQKNVMKIVRATIKDSIYREYYAAFFANVQAETSNKLFSEFADLVISVLYERYNNDQNISNEPIILLPEDLYRIESELGEENLNAEFIKLDNQPASLNDILQALAFEKFSVDTLDNNLIKIKLNSFVKRFIEYELLAREGYKRGLQNLPEVKRYLNMWRDYYLSEAFKENLSESIVVGDDEARKYFEIKKNDSNPTTQIKIIEILTEDLDIMRYILDELEEGADIRELAVKFTIREEAKNNDGELGYFYINQYGEIGTIASALNVGEIYGPVKVPEGFSLFKLIDKRDVSLISESTFEDLKDKLKAELKHQKFSDKIISKSVELANKYGVLINSEVLESIDILTTTTVVYRYFGFGGKLLAVPMTSPNYLWVKPWQEQQVLSP